MQTALDLRLSVAPMMDWTDPACRYLLRLISARTRLYTEMVPSQALWHGRAERFLRHHPDEAPVAVQLGGSDLGQIAHGAALAEQWGFAEVNLNVGCPSDRVQSGQFGACLMHQPDHVAALVTAMRGACDLPVTVKCRIGVDDNDSYEALQTFTAKLVDAGVDGLIVHARKAWLKGLSPKQNRDIPPLRYDRVRALKADFAHLPIVINGGIQDLDRASAWLESLDGVMIGRAAYQNPWILANADEQIFNDLTQPKPERIAVAQAYQAYVSEQFVAGVPVSRYTRHIIGLFQGLPGAKIWRRALSEGSAQKNAGPEVITQALERWHTHSHAHAAMDAVS